MGDAFGELKKTPPTFYYSMDTYFSERDPNLNEKSF